MPEQGYPLVLSHMAGALCVVVGGGAVAERKVEGLLAVFAAVRVVSPDATPTIRDWAEQGALSWLARPYRLGDLAGATLAFAATNQPEVNAAVVAEARAAALLVNSAEDPASGDFHTPASIRRGALLLTISTSGSSPALSALLRRRLEAALGAEVDELLAIMGELRPRAQALPEELRARLFRRLASEEVLGWLSAGRREQVDALIAQGLAGAL